MSLQQSAPSPKPAPRTQPTCARRSPAVRSKANRGRPFAFLANPSPHRSLRQGLERGHPDPLVAHCGRNSMKFSLFAAIALLGRYVDSAAFLDARRGPGPPTRRIRGHVAMMHGSRSRLLLSVATATLFVSACDEGSRSVPGNDDASGTDAGNTLDGDNTADGSIDVSNRTGDSSVEASPPPMLGSGVAGKPCATDSDCPTGGTCAMQIDLAGPLGKLTGGASTPTPAPGGYCTTSCTGMLRVAREELASGRSPAWPYAALVRRRARRIATADPATVVPAP